MRRKLIKQGVEALTVTLPSKWLKEKSLGAGDEVEIEEEDNKLSLYSTEHKKAAKTISLKLDLEMFNAYRSIIGGLYRAGYNEIKIEFDNKKVIPFLQKTVDSLYGFELFDIDHKSCTIRSIYLTEEVDLHAYTNRMIHNVVTMQGIISEDIKKREYKSKDELFQFRNNVLKQRDLIMRTIIEQKLLDNKHQPYNTISVGIWNVARKYYIMYENLESSKKYTTKNLQFLEQTGKFFRETYKQLGQELNCERYYKEYERLRRIGLELMKDKNEASVIVSFCINILMAIQSTESSMLILGLKE